ncbi:MAG: glycosyltransferase [Rhodothermales bacterium]|nr:glycosyltransferase [Rhodothermales bacterium]
MEVAQAILALAALIYAVSLLRIWYGLGLLRPGQVAARPPATVLVAARNEEEGLGACLKSLVVQDYAGPFEIVVLNDRSTDATGDIARSWAAREERVRVIDITPAADGTSPKKHALRTGLADTSGDLVFVTDADCEVPPGWMSGLASHFDEDIGLVTGAVFLPEAPGVVQRMLNLDFAAYTYCSAGAMRTGWPLIATAMNLAYRRKAFEEAGGFGIHAKVLSGDDDLLLHAIVRRTPWRSAFAFGADTAVHTHPVSSASEFMNQRMRWASKAFRYPPAMFVFLLATFALYAGLLVGLPLVALGLAPAQVVVPAAILKVTADTLVLIRGAARFRQRLHPTVFLPAAILHLPYILAASIGGTLGLFRWKGRKA